MQSWHKWALAAVLASLAALALRGNSAMAATQKASSPGARQPRGLRNKNPGNLRFVASIKWRGQVGDDGDGYAVFDSDLNGLRAAFLNLWSYMHTHGLETVRGIITRWAPAHENPTMAYAKYVAKAAGVGMDEPVSWQTHRLPIMRAIVAFEQGTQPFSDAFYREALRETGKQ